MSEKTVYICDGCGKDIKTEKVSIHYLNKNNVSDIFHTYSFDGVELLNGGHACPLCANRLKSFRDCGYEINFIVGKFNPDRELAKFKNNES